VRLLGVVGALALALVLQTTLTGAIRGAVPVDLVLVVVVSAALAFGPVTGLVAGTVGGLMQDALSSGVLGMGGLAKTLVGFAAGRFATQFIVTATVPRLLVFAAATAAHALLFMGLYTLLGLRSFPDPVAAVAIQAVGNAVIGVVGLRAVEAIPLVLERRRANRGMRVKR
jgi:rod shape-determining protein MreD